MQEATVAIKKASVAHEEPFRAGACGCCVQAQRCIRERDVACAERDSALEKSSRQDALNRW